MKELLLVMSSDDRDSLAQSLRSAGFEVVEASTWQEARVLLEGETIRTVVSEETLPDGTWCNLLRELRDGSADTELLVVFRRAQNWGWSRPVQRGGEFSLGLGHRDLLGFLERSKHKKSDLKNPRISDLGKAAFSQ